jgi:hypothetical protein
VVGEAAEVMIVVECCALEEPGWKSRDVDLLWLTNIYRQTAEPLVKKVAKRETGPLSFLLGIFLDQ